MKSFPYRFFVVTFAWSWLIWLPLVLAGAGIIPLGRDLLSAVTVPWIAVGVFGPAAGDPAAEPGRQSRTTRRRHRHCDHRSRHRPQQWDIDWTKMGANLHNQISETAAFRKA